jgi:hypothetical protein
MDRVSCIPHPVLRNAPFAKCRMERVFGTLQIAICRASRGLRIASSA